MSAERPTSTLERKPERKLDTLSLHSARAEKLAEIKKDLDRTEAAEPTEDRAAQARELINRQAETAPMPAAETAAPAPLRPAFFNHHINYHQTLMSMQRRLPDLNRAFSQAIHMPIVEKTSELLETTIARPSILLGSTWTALLVGTIFYLVARHYGYALSGSELLFSFIVGALIGLAGEGLWLIIRRR